MRYLVYFLISILLISLQTTVVPALPPLISLYDLLIPFVVFLVLFRLGRDGLIMILFVGYAMDILSGAPMGAYLTAYLCMFLLFRNVRGYFHINNRTLFQIVFVFAVLVELFIFGFFCAVFNPSFLLLPHTGRILFTQVLWAVITGPFIFILLKKAFDLLDGFFAGRFSNGGLP